MARVDPHRELTLSVLDRLLDDDPQVTREVLRPTLRDLKKAVRRDLENLLNTRRGPFSLPAGWTELAGSLVEYGLPDLSAADFASQGARDEFLRLIEGVLRRHEQRFAAVRVLPTETEEPIDRTLRFRIEARLHAEPLPEPVAYDSRLEPVSRTLEVEE